MHFIRKKNDFGFSALGRPLSSRKPEKKMQVENYLVVQGYIVTHTYRGDISYTYGGLNPRNVHTYAKKKTKQKTPES